MLLKSVTLTSDPTALTLTLTLELLDGTKLQITGETNFDSNDLTIQLQAMLVQINRFSETQVLKKSGKITEIAKL